MRDRGESLDFCALWQASGGALGAAPPSPARLERAARRIRLRLRAGAWLIVLICAGQVVTFSLFFRQGGSPLRRLGAVLTVLGMTFLAGQVWENHRRMRAISERLIAAPSVLFYRAMLAQIRAWSRGRWFWARFAALVPGPPLFMYAEASAHSRFEVSAYVPLFAYLGILTLAVVLNVLVAVRIVDKRLAALDQAARESSPETAT